MRAALALASLALASAGAGWWARTTVEEWRMRRLLVRVQATIADRH